MLQADILAVLFMKELKNLTNVVIEKLGKPVYKENCYQDFFILFYKLQCILVLVTPRIFLLLYNKKIRGVTSTRLGLHPSTHVEKEIHYIQYGPLLLYLILILRGRIYNNIAEGIIL